MTELERNNRISAEFDRISYYFKDLPENKKSIVLPLIQNAAFMRVTLDDLQKIIAEEGPVEQYMNGATQYGMKQSAALQSYNALIKNYGAVIKNLFGLLPPMERPKEIPKLEPREKTEEEMEEERLQEAMRYARQRAELKRASDYQQWMRDQEQAGIKPNMSFSQWMSEHPITDEELYREVNQ